MTYDLACTITGANGFVGRHLLWALMEQEEYSVRAFAVDLRFDDPLPHETHHASTGKTSSFTTHEWDVKQPLHSDFLGVDAVYHFAGIADPKRYIEDPITIMDLNLKGLQNILDRIVLWSAHRPRIIYSSTSEVYGLNTRVPFDEDDEKVFGPGMRWCYAQSKLLGEMYLRAYSQLHGVRHTIFRFFNFVGDDVDAPGAGRVLTKMVYNAMRDGVIYVTEPGDQTRCFTHIDDVLPVLVKALTMKKPHGSDLGIATLGLNPWESDYTMNLGNDDMIRMDDLARMIAGQLEREKFVNKPVRVELKPGTELYGRGYEDVLRRMPKLDAVQRVFNWVPKRQLHEFMPDVIRALAERTREQIDFERVG